MGSCVKEERIDPRPKPTTRVLLAYIGVDNNLSGYEQEKIDGLRKGWTGRTSDRLLAYVDTYGTGASLYELSVAPGSDLLLIKSYGAEDSADPETFRRVIDTVIRDCPAEQASLLVFSHASGWLPRGALSDPYKTNQTRSIIVDGNEEMELADFANAIPDGVFEYIVFETCFMAGIEVAYELRNKADYILASSAEIVHPGFTYVYETATEKLINNDIRGFGEKVFGHVLTYADDQLQHSATYSVIRTSALEALAGFIRQNCDFTKAVDVFDVQHFDRYSYRLFFDFEDYYSRLLETDAQRTELARLVNDCILWEAATPGFMNQQSGYNGFSIAKHSGLTTYILQDQFTGLNQCYRELQWSAAIDMP